MFFFFGFVDLHDTLLAIFRLEISEWGILCNFRRLCVRLPLDAVAFAYLIADLIRDKWPSFSHLICKSIAIIEKYAKRGVVIYDRPVETRQNAKEMNRKVVF